MGSFVLARAQAAQLFGHGHRLYAANYHRNRSSWAKASAIKVCEYLAEGIRIGMRNVAKSHYFSFILIQYQ
jgi:hypothetical protein